MLEPHVHEAIGRFTVAFNEVDFWVEVYIANLLDLPEFEISIWLADRESGFDRKKGLLKDLVNRLAKSYPILQPHVDSLGVFLTGQVHSLKSVISTFTAWQ